VPYDVVSTDEARALAAGNPLSFLRVTRSEIDLPPGTDPYSDQVYEQAGRAFEELKRSAPLLLEPEPGHVQHQVFLVQEPQHDLLAEQGRQHRHAVVHLLALSLELHLDLDSAVLGKALLGDVQLRHDLDAGGDGVFDVFLAVGKVGRGVALH